jgi:hypothetical protein
MFKLFREPSSVELEVERALRELKNHPIGSEDYNKTLDSIVVLHRMKEEEKPSTVSRDTLVIVGTNLLGILMIIQHERVDIASRAAMNLLMKPRI